MRETTKNKKEENNVKNIQNQEIDDYLRKWKIISKHKWT